MLNQNSFPSNGFPAAYLISKKIDAETFKTFFQRVRDETGDIRTRALMSDDYPAYYNAWKEVMSEPENRLICAWHVLHSWERNFKKIIDKKKQAEVREKMTKIMKTPDELEFKVEFERYLEQLLASKSTVEFGRYIATYYKNRTQAWAYCYRKGLGINTNMHLEAMHKYEHSNRFQTCE